MTDFFLVQSHVGFNGYACRIVQVSEKLRTGAYLYNIKLSNPILIFINLSDLTFDSAIKLFVPDKTNVVL